LDERNGDFSKTAAQNGNIYDPTQVSCTPPPNVVCTRPQVPGNVIPQGEIDPIGQAVLNLYPKPTNTDPTTDTNNFVFHTTGHAPGYQFDIKLDHQINDKQRINARYSRGWSNYTTPEVLADGAYNDGIANGPTTAQNSSLEHSWTVNPRIVWTNHVSLDRVYEKSTSGIPSISNFNASLPSGVQGLPSVLQQANGLPRMPAFFMNGKQSWSNLFDQCCIDTTFAHTLVSYSSQLVISKGSHLMKFGGEQRLFYNNFWQPQYPTGAFDFSDYVTSQNQNDNSEGNPFASLLFGYADNVNPVASPNVLTVSPSVANRSAETGFYFQDDWKVNSKLTVNLGIRYQWSTPYNERHNRIEFSNFTADTGVNISLSTPNSDGQSAQDFLQQQAGVSIPASVELLGTTIFPTSSHRSIPTYRNDFGPRLGFAYQLDLKTVVRGGAGIYFGMSPATNYQLTGTAFRKTATMFFTKDNFQSQLATLENPFPDGFTGPQGQQYGKLANWGYANNNDLGTSAARDAEIYQWNLGIQRELPSQIVLGVDYSANRSTHLPWSGTNNQDYIPSALLAQIAQAPNPSTILATNVANPFYSMFNGSCSAPPCFNEPNSNYGDTTIPLGNLLNKYPQFSGDFEGLALEKASSWYHAMQIRFQKRTTHNISFEGSYTISKSTDNSSAGRNNWVGSLGAGMPQQLDRLNLEHSISANDTPQRLALAVVVDLPIGRKQWIGGDMNRVLNGVVGGWSLATIITQQSGQPMAIGMSSPQLANGTQRPNVVCPQLKTGLSMDTVARNWQAAGDLAKESTFLNPSCFGDPGDQTPGNAPRYFSSLRVDGIHNVDMNIYKSFVPREGMKLDVRVEMFNFFNHPRFGQPNSAVGDDAFGTITSDGGGYTPRAFQFGMRVEF
jgi:hypothetical protein